MNYTLKFYNTYIAKYKKGGRIRKAVTGFETNNDDYIKNSNEEFKKNIVEASEEISKLLTDKNFINQEENQLIKLIQNIISRLKLSLEISLSFDIYEKIEDDIAYNKEQARTDETAPNFRERAADDIYNIITSSNVWGPNLLSNERVIKDSKEEIDEDSNNEQKESTQKNTVKPKWQARTSSLIKKDMEKDSILFNKGVYTVRSHDTPWGIAKAAGISLNKLAEYNPDKIDKNGKWKTIYVGDVFNLKEIQLPPMNLTLV